VYLGDLDNNILNIHKYINICRDLERLTHISYSQHFNFINLNSIEKTFLITHTIDT